MNIPISKIEFTTQDIEGVNKVLESGWIVQGPKVKEFEDSWSRFTGSRNSVAVSSCTTALHLALIAAGVKPGDEVIVPSFTWIATANAVEYTGAKPIFCDINLSTFNINESAIERLVTKKTKAIIPVHLFGLMCDMEAVTSAAKKYNLKVIEDAACGFGAYYKGTHAGSFGEFGCFSFHPRKAISTGEGGMITTGSDEAASTLRTLRDHGASVSDLQRHQGNMPYLLPEFNMLGYNYRMTDIQASLGVTQMKRAKMIIKRRGEIAAQYAKRIGNVEWLTLPSNGSDYRHGYQSFVCLFTPVKITDKNIEKVRDYRNKFMKYLMDNGINTRPGTHAVHALGYYASKYGIKRTDFINSYIADSCSVSLPFYPGLENEQIEYIADKIISYKFNN